MLGIAANNQIGAWMKNRIARVSSCLLTLLACSLTNATEWVHTWGAAPMAPLPLITGLPITPSFQNQTIRQTVRISVGGQRIRILFTNEFGAKPLTIGAARVALADANGNVQPGTERTVLFSGKPTAVIPAGSPFWSDPIDLSVKNLASLSISIYLPEATGKCTCHMNGFQTALVSETGDYTAKDFTPKEKHQWRAFISGVQTEVAGIGRAVVTLGDSITDGDGSTPNTNRRWPDFLAQRLNKTDGSGWGVVNMGISGNRVLADGAGQSALARFDRDVLAVAGVKAVVIFEGVNDLNFAYGRLEGPMGEELAKVLGPRVKVTADSMIAGYRQLIARAHAKGIKVYGATITPYEGIPGFSDVGDAVRQEINAWIRAGREFDGVLDFDAVLRDPTNPKQIKDGLHPGDHIHGSDAGYEAMAESIDLSLFK
jgi:lysophospholipase L1-like esterase